MKIFIDPATKQEVEITNENLYSIYENYGYKEKKITKPKNSKK